MDENRWERYSSRLLDKCAELASISYVGNKIGFE